MQDPDLPPLPQPTPFGHRPAILTRKRTRDDYQDDIPVSAASSDPAMFSGDETVPGAEDYAVKRKKKLYTGTWWNHRFRATRDHKKRDFKRNFDSGIFMGSESSDPPSSDSLDSLEEEFVHDLRKMEPHQQDDTKKSIDGSEQPFARTTGVPFKTTVPDIPPEHAQVIKIVQRSLDDNQESVDLSSMSLTSLPSEITSLNTLTKHMTLVDGMLDHGERLEAYLRVFLASNLFRRVPRELLDLTNLRELSLRQNKITHLPCGIRRLVRLEILNIAGNRLTHLPFEVVELARWNRLGMLLTANNPWLPKPEISELGKGSRWARDVAIELLYRWQSPSKAFRSQDTPSVSENVPSLTEMTLRSLKRLHPQTDLRTYMPPDTPDTVLAALKRLHDSHLDGEYRCSRCYRQIIQAGHEETEWWAFGGSGYYHTLPASQVHDFENDFQRALPIKRMFCHRDCNGRENAWCDYPDLPHLRSGQSIFLRDSPAPEDPHGRLSMA